MFTDTIKVQLIFLNSYLKLYSIPLKNVYTTRIDVDTGYKENGYDITYNAGNINLYSIKNLQSISVEIYGAYDEGAGAYFNENYQYLVTSNWWHYQGNKYVGTKNINQTIINNLKKDNTNVINIKLHVYDLPHNIDDGVAGGARGYLLFKITEMSQ